jgi:HAD superfamily hydrolase (TIGR01509 family)
VVAIRALLFDFDGVVVDTEVPTYASWRDVYREHGAELSIQDWLPAVGTGSSVSGAFDAVALLEQLTGTRIDREEVIARRRALKAQLCDSASLLPGVREYLDRAAELGLATAIVTRNTEDWVERHCRRVRLDHRWSSLICANANPMQNKALLYRRALELLGVEADAAIALEDSPAGAQAAKRAGVWCVAVPNEITRAAAFDGADLVVDSLAELPLDALLETAGAGFRRSGFGT